MSQEQSPSAGRFLIPDVRYPMDALSGMDVYPPAVLELPQELPRPELTLFMVAPESPTMNIVVPPGIEASL